MQAPHPQRKDKLSLATTNFHFPSPIIIPFVRRNLLLSEVDIIITFTFPYYIPLAMTILSCDSTIPFQ